MQEANMANPKSLEIYGPIGEGENTPEAISRKLKALNLRPGATADLRIDSPGGDCFMGNAIFNLLAGAGLKWTIYVDGVAASMASLIAALPGAHVIMAENAFIMIHNPAAWTNGGSRDLTRAAKLLDSIRDGMAASYAKRSGLPLATVTRMMDDETWLNADEAVAKGFADQKGDNLKMAAHFDFAPFGYLKVPTLTSPTKSFGAFAESFWAGKGKPVQRAPDNPDDIRDLVPDPITAAQAWSNFHGKYAGRRG